MHEDLDALEAAIGYRFADRDLLRRALTHSSRVYERTLAGGESTLRDNEQLEFLGDAVLGFLISDELLLRHPDASEGRLSKLKANLVREPWLAAAALRLKLGDYLQLGRGEEMSGGRAKKTLLADAFEALIAAVYLDGGIDAARSFVEIFVATVHPEMDHTGQPVAHDIIDYKGALQELARARKLPPPAYIILRESGPGHSKIFTVEVRIGNDWAAQAEGSTKKSAAQKAAREVYERLRDSAAG
jgi:ribonuclease-3